MLRELKTTRYGTPFRKGSSLPALAEGALGELSQAERFRWLTAPRNTLIQTSPVHSGLTDDPEKTLEHLVATLVQLAP